VEGRLNSHDPHRGLKRLGGNHPANAAPQIPSLVEGYKGSAGLPKRRLSLSGLRAIPAPRVMGLPFFQGRRDSFPGISQQDPALFIVNCKVH
jgi:hypothetical protein